MGVLPSLAARARQLASAYHVETANLLNSPRPDVPDSAAEAAFELNYSCAVSTDSALLLLVDEHIWDADILARSIVEGTLKSLYLLSADAEGMESRAAEFFETIPGCQAVSRLRKAHRLLEQVEDSNAADWYAVREVVEIDSDAASEMERASRASRQQVQERWSFGGLVEHMAGIKDLQPMAVLGFKYAMQSHLVHKDADGTGWMYARSEKEPSLREAAQAAHGARIVHDLLDMAGIRADMAKVVSARDAVALWELEAQLDLLLRALRVLEPDGLRPKGSESVHA